jgi:hypothetical protein
MEPKIAFDEREFRVALVRASFRSAARPARCAGLSEAYSRQIAHSLVPAPDTRAALPQVDSGAIWGPLSAVQ